MTNTTSEKARDKVLSKIKSYTQEMEMNVPQAPFPLKGVEFWGAPSSKVQTIEAQGMTFQKSYFDGTSGYEMNMQTGKKDMTAEDIAAGNKYIGIIPEINYAKSGIKYELTGIENQDGKDVYVVKTDDGKNERYDYYD